MDSIVTIGHEVPFILPLGTESFLHVLIHLFHVLFGFTHFSIIIEEEVHGNYGVIK